MSGALRNSITAMMGRAGLGGGRAKSTTGLAAVNFFYWGNRGTWSLDASAKYNTAVMPSRSPAAGGGDEEQVGAGSGDEGRGGRQARLQRRGLASRRQARALRRRKRRWLPLQKATCGRVVGNTVTTMLVGNIVVFFYYFEK
jgi:hypothetical protein